MVGLLLPSLRLQGVLADLQQQSPSLALSWIIPSIPLHLQRAIDPVSPQWTDLTNAPALTLTNLSYQLTLPAGNPAEFYRLSAQ